MSTTNENQEPPRKSTDLLDAANIITAFKHHKPTFRNGFDAIVAALHTLMKDLDFKCLGVGDTEQLDANTKFLPDGWNQSSEFYSLKYKHAQSSMTFVIKSLTIGEVIIINASALEDKSVHSIEVNLANYINKSAPLDDYVALFKNLQGLINLFNKEIIQRIVPGLQKPGYHPSQTEGGGGSSNETTTSTSSQNQPRPVQPSIDYDPYYNDPLREPPRTGRGGYHMPPDPYGPPFGMGGNDLYPFGRGSYVPPVPGPGTGNLIGPNHPGFGPLVTDPYGGTPYGPVGRGRGRGSFPPGARFDPYGPPGMPFPGGPDPDDLPPPGMGNMFL